MIKEDPVPMATSILERRRIEAAFAGHIYTELEARLGTEEARALLGAAIKRAATDLGREMAAEMEAAGGTADLEGFAALLPRWQQEDALRIAMIDRGPDRLSFDVTRCRYAEMYRDMGLGHLGDLLSCNRDGTFIEGFNADARLDRPQTIMQGASHCPFRYSLASSSASPDPKPES